MSKISFERPSKSKAIGDFDAYGTQETVRLNINISKAVYKKLKAMTINDDLSITAVVTKLIIDHINSKK